jgi:voltage-gated potassium channel
MDACGDEDKKLLYFLITLRNKIFLPFFILYILVASFVIYWIEPQTFEPYITSIYWVLTTLATVGFGDYAPVTTPGKVFTIVLYISGIGLVSVFIGKVINSVHFIDKLKAGEKMKYTGKIILS